jgi:WD40 repeat protein
VRGCCAETGHFQVAIMKTSFPLLFVGLLLAGFSGGVLLRAETLPQRAEMIPQRAADRIIELASTDSEEKMPVVSSVALDPGGRFVAAVGDDHLVRVFDVASGKLLHRWASHTDWVKASMFRPDGVVLATAGDDGRVCFWNAAASERGKMSEPFQTIYTIAFSPDGRILAAAGFAEKIWILDGKHGTLIHELAAPGNDIRAIAFSSDGQRMAAAGRSGLLRIWNTNGWQPVVDEQVSPKRIYALAYSPDGRVLAAAGQQRIVQLLDPTSGKSAAYLPERSGEVLSLCFCGPDTLVSAGSGNVIHVWDVVTRQERCQLTGHTGSVTTLVFNAAAATLISGSYDTTVRLWDVKNWNEERVSRR